MDKRRYDDLCKKMGFDPLKDKPTSSNDPWLINDSPRPYSKLKPEEFDDVYDYFLEHYKDVCA
jgi:hypothetical protein